MSRNRIALPDGGRYTRPRRGFRAISSYGDKLKARGLTSRSVAMPDLRSLRAMQNVNPDMSLQLPKKRRPTTSQIERDLAQYESTGAYARGYIGYSAANGGISEASSTGRPNHRRSGGRYRNRG